MRFLPLSLLNVYLIISIVLASACCARDATFSWTANREKIDGYRLYVLAGTAGNINKDHYTEVREFGEITSYTYRGLEDNQTYHFALTAFRESDNQESDFSRVITLGPIFVLQIFFNLLLFEESH